MKVSLNVHVEVDLRRLVEDATHAELDELERLIQWRKNVTGLTADELELLKDERKIIEVVKMVRCRTHLPLKDSKVLVDKFLAAQKLNLKDKEGD